MARSSSQSSSVLSALSDDERPPVVDTSTEATAETSIDDENVQPAMAAVEPRMTRKRKISNATTTTRAATSSKGKGVDVVDVAAAADGIDEDCPVCRMMPLEHREKLRTKSVQWICCEECVQLVSSEAPADLFRSIHRCNTWYHWPCVKGDVPGKQGRVGPADFEEWYCDKCIAKSIADEKRNPLASRMKEGTRKSARRKNDV